MKNVLDKVQVLWCKRTKTHLLLYSNNLHGGNSDSASSHHTAVDCLTTRLKGTRSAIGSFSRCVSCNRLHAALSLFLRRVTNRSLSYDVRRYSCGSDILVEGTLVINFLHERTTFF